MLWSILDLHERNFYKAFLDLTPANEGMNQEMSSPN